MKTFIGNNLIASLKPREKAYDIWDNKLPGFILRVSPTGRIVYRCEYGRGKRITLGNSSILTPAQARDHARELLADVVKGIQPQKKKDKREIPTLKEFLEREYTPWRHANRKSAEMDIKRLAVNFIDKFGNKLLPEINPLLLDKWRSKRINDG